MIIHTKDQEIIKALFSVSRELKNPLATADNPFYKSKYVPLSDLLEHIKPSLEKNNLFISQSPGTRDGFLVVTTTLFHISGDYIQTETAVNMGQDAQKTGGSITYARRYAISAIFSLGTEMDDDGNSSVNHTGEHPKQQKKLEFKEMWSKLESMATTDEITKYKEEIKRDHPNLTEGQEKVVKKAFEKAWDRVTKQGETTVAVTDAFSGQSPFDDGDIPF